MRSRVVSPLNLPIGCFLHPTAVLVIWVLQRLQDPLHFNRCQVHRFCNSRRLVIGFSGLFNRRCVFRGKQIAFQRQSSRWVLVPTCHQRALHAKIA
jgi:hypothetical protein